MGLFKWFKFGSTKESPTPTGSVTFGVGNTHKDAVVIIARTEMEGISMEYGYLNKTYGPKNVGWGLNLQYIIKEKSGWYDVFDITLRDGTQQQIYFNINSFYGKTFI